MFAQRLAGHSAARITHALNDAEVPCPSAADPGRNPHRTGAGWTLRTVAAILANPRYTGRQVWNRQRTDFDLADPSDTALGHRQVQRWNLPEGWVISKRPAHTALVSEGDFIAAQDTAAARGPAGPAVRRYLLAGLLACGRCGRRLESAWSNGKPAYRCRHGHSSATRPQPGRPGNTYVREDQILPHLAAIAILLTDPPETPGRRNRRLARVTGPASTATLIDQLLHADGIVLTRSSGARVGVARMLVFVVAGIGCGAAGALLAVSQLIVQPSAVFSVQWTAYMAFAVIIGGLGTIEGPILGTIVYMVLQQTLQSYNAWYLIILGLVAMGVAIFARRGLWGLVDEHLHVRLFPVGYWLWDPDTRGSRGSRRRRGGRHA
jgi:Recombinase/Branched-chain amino acid transport system / permease component/Recombinase zinc beta ribbon domain